VGLVARFLAYYLVLLFRLLSAYCSVLRMKLQQVALTLFIIVTVFFLLHVGQSLLQPLVIAIVVAYLISILAHAISSIPLGEWRVPKVLSMVLAVGVILASISMLISLITENIRSVIGIAPGLQENLEARIYDVYALFGVEREEAPNLQEFMAEIDLRAYLQDFGKTVRNIVSRTGIIFVYLVFVLLEQRTFTRKIKALVPNKHRQEEVFTVIDRILKDIRLYIGIKVLTSASTGLLSYLVLKWIGVNFASFWAVLIFLLNFIPTIGSIIATIFPSAMALIQFDTFRPFVICVIAITAIQLVIGSFIDPKLMGNRLNLSPLVILFSLGLWGAVWGIPGMFLCVPFTVIIMIICAYFPTTRPVSILLSGNGKVTVGRSEPAQQ